MLPVVILSVACIVMTYLGIELTRGSKLKLWAHTLGEGFPERGWSRGARDPAFQQTNIILPSP